MTPARYILRSVLHYRFAYAGVLAGAVLGAMVLLGALFAGDSVRESLKQISANRTGRATHVVTAGDRFFREALATDVAKAAQARVAPVLSARGTAAHASTGMAANQVQLLGVTETFWQFAPRPSTIGLDPTRSAVAVNRPLAQRLRVQVGDTLVVRLQKPGVLAGNAPVAGSEATLQTLRCAVAAVVDEASYGRFTLEATQLPPSTVYLPIRMLQDALAQPGRANLLLLESQQPAAQLQQALTAAAQLADYGLSLLWLERAQAFEVRSNRVFLDPGLADAVIQAAPQANPVVSYLVNEFRVGDRATPYSIATAAPATAAPFVPADLGPREVVINSWLAEDLQAKAGDDVRLTFFQVSQAGALVEQHATFRVRSVIPLAGLAADRDWMPNFPGITDTPNQSEWDPGLPLDLKRIREKDERYWDDYRGAPKAFLSVDAGREIWSTRWGRYTGMRIPMEGAREEELSRTLRAVLRPEMNQIVLRPFQAAAQESAQSPVDFGGLFIGMSFFLILAALGLVAMLFQLGLLQRNREDALLGAVGLSPRTLLRWRLVEAATVLVLGSLGGLGLAMLYTRGILAFLESIWAGQAGDATFTFAAAPTSVAIGIGAFLLLSLLALWLAIRKQTRRALSIRLAAHAEEVAAPAGVRRSSRLIAVASFVVAVLAIALSGRGLPAQAAFYIAGFALLAAGIAVCRASFARESTSGSAEQFGPSYVGSLNVKARRSRSLTVVGLIATAVFMVLSVASFRKHVGDEWLDRSSGTGGFAFWIETTAPLNLARDGRSAAFESFEPLAKELGDILPLRAGTGDNANCFNLNSTSQPKLLGVESARLAARRAFTVKTPHASGSESPWSVLRQPGAKDAVRAFVDETTLLWALKRKVGDVLQYTDENGRPFAVEIAGTIRDSLFQGYLLIDEERFLQRFPSNGGYSVFLSDARYPADAAALRTRLETSLRDAGGRVELTRDVLASFHEIENTYIAIFNVLGSLGVILGSLGLAIVIARNLRERRGEFAVLSAIGIPRAVLGRMVFAEFGRLVAWGIVIGAVASLIAVAPNLTALPAAATFALVAGLLFGIIALNLVSGWVIFRWSTRDLRPGMEQAAA